MGQGTCPRVPISAPSTITRFNGLPAVQLSGSPAAGYSSGQALAALEEVAAQTVRLATR
ncbi:MULTISPECIES: efflux RND transporter permease subunit [Pelosinus]|uniref:efflux RND transporter permease subunit n=1 Tax=Pelosinus TaxID=365348 RepID=UPI00030E5782|nr:MULTISPECIES: efflux RND transporter permease subunit [Pelosinus]